MDILYRWIVCEMVGDNYCFYERRERGIGADSGDDAMFLNPSGDVIFKSGIGCFEGR